MSIIITTESYKSDLKLFNPNIEVLDEYISAKTHIKHKCLICGNIWLSTPNNIKNGHGCPECKKTKLKADKIVSHDDFIKKYSDSINSNVQVIGVYSGFHNNIHCKCIICNEEFDMSVPALIKGSMHKTCAMKRYGETIAKTHEQFEQELKEINPNIKIVEKYNRSFDKIKCKCLICENVWYGVPNNLLNGKGCPKCGIKKRVEKQCLSHDEFCNRLKNITNKIIPIDKYENSKTPMLFKCLKHNVEWRTLPFNILNGDGCYECRGEKISRALLKTNEMYLDELSEKKIDVTPLEEYQGATVKIRHKYNSCGHEALVQPSSILSGYGCLICAKEHYGDYKIKTNEQYIEEIKQSNPCVISLEKYYRATQKIKHKCLICGNIWDAYPTNILRGHGCPICNMSFGERSIYKYLKNNFIEFEMQKMFDNLIGVGDGLLSYDFYLPKLNTLIEYQGEQHEHAKKYFGGEEKLKIQQEHDRRKREYAKEHNINLIEIWYYDYDNIESILNTHLNFESVETTGDTQQCVS